MIAQSKIFHKICFLSVSQFALRQHFIASNVNGKHLGDPFLHREITGVKYKGDREDYYAFHRHLKKIVAPYGLSVNLQPWLKYYLAVYQFNNHSHPHIFWWEKRRQLMMNPINHFTPTNQLQELIKTGLIRTLCTNGFLTSTQRDELLRRQRAA